MPKALVATLLALLVLPLVVAQAPLPEGCELDAGRYVCAWQVDTAHPSRLRAPADPLGQPAVEPVRLEIPVFARGLAVVSVEALRGGAAWECSIARTEADGADTLLSACGRVRDAGPAPLVAPRTESTLPLLTEPTMRHVIDLDAPFSGSVHHVVYVVEPLPEGARPAHPAATREDPHVEDIPRDAPRGAVDILTAWFDDVSVGDGLFEAHVAVRDLNDTGLAGLVGVPDPTGTRDIPHVDVDASFKVGESAYRLRWTQHAREDVPETCTLFTMGTDARPVAGGGVTLETETAPLCTFDRESSTLHATIPERSVGDPAPGELFTDLVVRGIISDSGRLEEIVDETEGERYAFALGGPAVWGALNPRLALPEARPAAWYVAPLAPDNLPNTLQVAGALLAALTFVGGLVVVVHRRRRLRALLAEIDAITRAPLSDAVRLARLHDLERSFDDRLHQGRITDAEYQIVSHRVATAATRLAIRRGSEVEERPRA